MKKVVVSFGLIAGVIVSAMLFLTMYLYSSGVEIKNGELIGYTTMIIAFSTIFFGIRTYRDQYQAGTIRFGKAFQVGLFITIIASFMYVASWMIISAVTGDAFIEQYTQKMIAELKASDQSPEEIDTQIQEIKNFQEMYENPVIKIGMTLLEILPVGLLVSLICAAVLMRKPGIRTKKEQIANRDL